MSCILDLLSNVVLHTFIGINGTRTLIEICFVFRLYMLSYGILH